MLSFLRWGDDGSCVAVVCNFAGVPHEGYRIGLPQAGEWRELLNTDAEIYAGSGIGNFGAVTAVDEPCHGQPASATLRLPPLGVLYLDAPAPAPAKPTTTKKAQSVKSAGKVTTRGR